MLGEVLRRLGRRLLVAVLVLVLAAVPLAMPADAGWTPDKCDSDEKYWCYAVYYLPDSGAVTLHYRWYWGSLGGGGAVWWRRWITQDWRNNSGSWSFLGGWAEGPIYYGTDTETVSASRYVSNEAVVRMQNRFKSTSGHEYCDGYIDWHIADSGHYWSQGPFGCLDVIY